MKDEINIFRVLDYIRDTAPKYAQAKANRVQLEEFRKSKKAMLFQDAPGGTIADREAYSYAHADYIAVLDGLKAAVEEEEKYRWMLEAARLKAGCWQTLEANKRVEAKTI